MILTTLYKRDSKNKLRQWSIEVEGPKYRMITGLVEGKKVTTKWTIATPKNEGKSNGTTPDEQAIAEAKAEITKQKKKNYVDSLGQVKSLEEQTFKSPMLAKSWKDHKHKVVYPVYANFKYDGIRCSVSEKGMFSRNGTPLVSCPHIFQELKDWIHINLKSGWKLDGELYNHEFHNDFNRICELVKKTKPTKEDLQESARLVEYHVYDMDILGWTFKQRYNFLLELENKFPHIKVVKAILCKSEKDLDSYYEEALEKGYEGQIIRTPHAKYQNKRTNDLLKRKEFLDKEFQILEICPGIGNRSSVAGFLRVRDIDSGKEFKSGIKGTFGYCKKLLEDKNQLVGKMGNVRYFNITPDGVPRFPVFYGVREDL